MTFDHVGAVNQVIKQQSHVIDGRRIIVDKAVPKKITPTSNSSSSTSGPITSSSSQHAASNTNVSNVNTRIANSSGFSTFFRISSGFRDFLCFLLNYI